MNMKKIILGFMITVFYSSLAFGINLKQLDLNADSFNERIWSEVDSPISLIQERLGFLDDGDNIKEYTHCEGDFKTEKIDTDFPKILSKENLSHYKAFAGNCLEIYHNHAETDKATQVAVSMLFKRVTKKFLEQQKFLEQHYLLAASIKEKSKECLSFKEEKEEDISRLDRSDSLSPEKVYENLETLNKKDGVALIKTVNTECYVLGMIKAYRNLHLQDKDITIELLKEYPKEQDLIIKLLNKVLSQK